jgi:hypothetical protein
MGRKSSVWLGIALIATALVAAVALLIALPQKPTRRLRDGSVITLEAVTYGKEHHYAQESGWRRLLEPIIPGLKPSVDALVGPVISPNARTLVFWTRRRSARPGVPITALAFRRRVYAFDEHGCLSETGWGCSSVDLGWPPTEVVEAWALPAFPRRSRTVGLRIIARDPNGQWVPWAEFCTSNPTPGPHPTWTAQPLPLIERAGNLTVTLTGLTTGIQREGTLAPATGNEEAWSRATFRLTQGGRPTIIWTPAGITLSDPTGNIWSPRDTAGGHTGGEETFSFLGNLWPDETAWKLRVRLARTAAFHPNELWVVRGLAVPGLRQSVRLTQTAERQGAELGLWSISGAIRGQRAGDDPSLVVRMSPVSDNLMLTLLRATDDRGRDVTPPFSTYLGGDRFSFSLFGAAFSKRVNLTFAVQKPRFVEFLARPARL